MLTMLSSNDPAVLEKIIYTYSDALVRYAYSYVRNASVAEDIMEDAVASLYVKNKSFSSMEQIRTWLYKAVHGKAVDYIRKERTVPLEDVEYVLASADMESAFLTRERNAIVYKAIQSLSDQYRQVLILSYFEDFSVSQICTILRKTPKQIYNLLSRAKAQLKDRLMKEGYSYEDL